MGQLYILSNLNGNRVMTDDQPTIKSKYQYFILILATFMGLVITFIDSQPNWDDTGISALLLLSAAMLCGYLYFQKPWLIALAVGIWIPLTGMISSQNFEGCLALIPAFLGAYSGYFIRTMLASR